MPNLIDLRGTGPVTMPDDMLGPLGFMSGVLYKVLLSDWSWEVYIASFDAIADARDAMRADRHQQNMRFEELLAAEARRQANIPEPSAALRAFERQREDDAVSGRVY